MRGALTNGYEWLFFLLTMDVFLCTDVFILNITVKILVKMTGLFSWWLRKCEIFAMRRAE